MVDQKLLLKELDSCIEKWERRSVPKKEVLKLSELIKEKNKLTEEWQKELEKKNKKSKEIEVLFKNPDKKANVENLKKEIGLLKKAIEKSNQKREQLEKEVHQKLLNLPNFPHDLAPDGQSSADNKEIMRENFDLEFFDSQEFLPHWNIMEKLDIFDQKRASKITGSLFAVLKGSGAKLLRSLLSFGFDLFEKEGFVEFVVPSLVNTESLTGTGQLPKFAEEAYHIEKDDLWAIPTAEVPLTALHSKEILSKLPLKYMAHTSCFRREAGAAGQESRGLKRLHEFHKLELVKLCEPQEGEKELESLLKTALKPIQLLKLPYRVLDLCTADLTFSSARTYDIEVYSPGTKSWLEVSSVSLFTDYQSRRSKIRYKKENQIHYVSTLNGSGLATPRVMAGLLENYYESARSRVKIPEALIPYMKQNYL